MMKSNFNILPGRPYPLGSTWRDGGVNFALYAENATAVTLCLFDTDSTAESFKVLLEENTDLIWHVFIEGLQPGQLYGYRVDGPYQPNNGYRFNVNKLLADPYAKAIAGTIKWNDALFGYEVGHPEKDLSFSDSDSAPFVPKSVVIDSKFDWDGDTPPNIPYENTVIYEAHVKGLTKLHPEIPEEIRGTYAAVGHTVMINYLKALGITSLELMPVHDFLADRHLEEKGLTNYWGYNTMCFFAPDSRYAYHKEPGGQVDEFKTMVKNLHAAGIEVILDVVYNHTGEGNEMGPTLSFKGIDNAIYYRLVKDDQRYYMDYTGTGNTLNANLPNVLRLMMDSLRYWITEMHVDGFRFDLAATLARGLHEVNQLGGFLDIIHQDPIISQVKLIAEPWDVGEGGYQVGKFPAGWAEWNGEFRDAVRQFWNLPQKNLPEFAKRIAGSADLYKDYRKPTASINFITAHDGFTLNDLVSYNEKHNEANGDDNNDGESNNRSYNYGVEGATSETHIQTLRDKQKRNFLATLFFAQGVPMLLGGDEFGRTQQGNNNGYCQDNELSWINWAATDDELLAYTKALIQMRKTYPVLTRKDWFKGKPIVHESNHDIAWFLPTGDLMRNEEWPENIPQFIGLYLNGKEIHSKDSNGKAIISDDLYIIFNAEDVDLEFRLPAEAYNRQWTLLMNTSSPNVDHTLTFKPNQVIQVSPKSVVLLKGLS